MKAETLQAAELLVLRRDTLRIINGAGPSLDAPQSASTAEGPVSATEAERVSSPIEQLENPAAPIPERSDMVDQAPSTQSEHVTSHNAVRDNVQPTQMAT